MDPIDHKDIFLTFLPRPVFNAGPRICLGMNMAIQEVGGRAVLSASAQHPDFIKTPFIPGLGSHVVDRPQVLPRACQRGRPEEVGPVGR